MAVLLVAIFPIVLMINSQLAWLGLSVGISLLYYDSRQQARPQAAAPGWSSVRAGSVKQKSRRRTSATVKRAPMGVAQLRSQA